MWYLTLRLFLSSVQREAVHRQHMQIDIIVRKNFRPQIPPHASILGRVVVPITSGITGSYKIPLTPPHKLINTDPNPTSWLFLYENERKRKTHKNVFESPSSQNWNRQASHDQLVSRVLSQSRVYRTALSQTHSPPLTSSSHSS